MCRSSGENASAQAVEAEPAEPEEERNSTRGGTVSLRHFWNPDNSDLLSGEFGNPLNMITDSGAEEHVVSSADWKSLGEPLLNPAQGRLRSATGAWMVR